MITIGEIVKEIIQNSPFLEESLADDLINISSLARKIKPQIEKKLQKEIQIGAIIMAIKRIEPGYYHKINIGLKNFVNNIGDFIVRSDLMDSTFENSKTLISRQLNLLKIIGENQKIFYSVSRGIFETTLIVSNSIKNDVNTIFASEKMISQKFGLSSITIKLPEENTEISGFYYFILKNLAWENINIVEIISTTNEFTILVKDKDIDKAFSILLKLKKT
ncbi:MAG: aspartate kinase [Bacteroidales bacterium]|nr:aspartate kinase [Bacteroidales bacterium]MBN2756878.1 aspartate kinase [Bacteroidales bacterium]